MPFPTLYYIVTHLSKFTRVTRPNTPNLIGNIRHDIPSLKCLAFETYGGRVPKFKQNGYRRNTDHALFGVWVICRLVLPILNLCTKFEKLQPFQKYNEDQS